ncbi:hypothetical protein [Pseudoduganella sp. HUAS MS19]
MKRRSIYLVLGLLVLALLAASIWVWERNGAYGFNVLKRRGGTYWTQMGTDDARLPPSMRQALKDMVPAVSAGQFYWREFEPGFASHLGHASRADGRARALKKRDGFT